MAKSFCPSREDELVEVIASAASDDTRLLISGGGSKAGIGRPVPEVTRLDMRGFTGIVDYDPAELVLTVRSGTPLAEVQALVAERSQMLAFEPFDHGPIFGENIGRATIGGVVAAAVAGSQRVSAGSARDHLLGFRAVSGRGELFVAGAKVVKNVTGYDLPKLAAGSWGRLFAMTELTLKVLPSPRFAMTRAILGLTLEEAISVMALAMGSQADIAAAAHFPADHGRKMTMTLFRLQGFEQSVIARCQMLVGLLPHHSLIDVGNDAHALWDALKTLALFDQERPLWRVNVPPSGAATLIAAVQPYGARWALDWAGGLAWLAFDGDPTLVRDAALHAGGHATLIRAPATLRSIVPAHHPQSSGVTALEERLRRAFDPQGVFETGRF